MLFSISISLYCGWSLVYVLLYYCITLSFYIEGWFCSNTKACSIEEGKKIRQQLAVTLFISIHCTSIRSLALPPLAIWISLLPVWPRMNELSLRKILECCVLSSISLSLCVKIDTVEQV